jgi:hypothetical protein
MKRNSKGAKAEHDRDFRAHDADRSFDDVLPSVRLKKREIDKTYPAFATSSNGVVNEDCELHGGGAGSKSKAQKVWR